MCLRKIVKLPVAGRWIGRIPLIDRFELGTTVIPASGMNPGGQDPTQHQSRHVAYDAMSWIVV